jgi:hypothetical protein
VGSIVSTEVPMTRGSSNVSTLAASAFARERVSEDVADDHDLIALPSHAIR